VLAGTVWPWGKKSNFRIGENKPDDKKIRAFFIWGVSSERICLVVSDRRWFRPKDLAEYSAETEYSARATKTRRKDGVFSKNCFTKKLRKIVKKTLTNLKLLNI
jgi:hypothetical protein